MIIGYAFLVAMLDVPPLLLAYTDLKCGVSEVERSLRDMVVLHG